MQWLFLRHLHGDSYTRRRALLIIQTILTCREKYAYFWKANKTVILINGLKTAQRSENPMPTRY